MATAAEAVRQVATRTGYRRLLVPISGSSESEHAVELACSLAAERSELTAVFVIEVSPLLPLDARMEDDEAEARAALLRAEAIGDSFGVRVHGRTVRAREAGCAIVELAEQTGADVVVLAAPRKRRAYRRLTAFGGTVRHVLAKAPCPVLVAAPRAA